MSTGRLVFSHLLQLISQYDFKQCVERYNGNKRVRRFSCYDQFLCMVFAQLTGRESLRDIEICLRSLQNKLYHAGFRGGISKSTLADANEKRDYRIYEDLAHLLIARVQKCYARVERELPINEAVYALDATNIDLCLSLFPWAQFKKTKGAIRLHTLLDLHGNIPVFISITNGKVYETVPMDEIPWQAGAYYVMDRGYIDFTRLYRITSASAFFIIRVRHNLRWKRVYSHPCDRAKGIICDQTIALQSKQGKKDYPVHLRRIRCIDKEKGSEIEIFTNNFTLTSDTLSALYKARWQIELFFKWIKQHLRIKAFFGTSENAVKTQIWIAVTAYLLITLIKQQLNLPQPHYTLSQIFSLTLFEKTADLRAFIDQQYTPHKGCDNNQLNLL